MAGFLIPTAVRSHVAFHNALQTGQVLVKLRSTFAFVLAAAAIAGPALAQAPDSVLAISQGGVNILRVNEDGGLVVRGTAGVGGIPAEGSGVRMMWFPGSYAFRAGQVTGTQWNLANVGAGSVAFGTDNVASGANSFAAGMEAEATGERSVSFSGTASGEGSLAVGSGSTAGGDESVAVGVSATSTGMGSTAIGPSIASGTLATSIGFGSVASGDNSVAIGWGATTAARAGSVVISTGPSTVASTADNQFVVGASGGTIIYTSSDLTSGVELTPGAGSGSTVSDRNRKMNFAQLDGEQVLIGLRNVPVTTWSYVAQGESIRHAGPMAQDFYAAFGLGENDVTISTVDMDGITLAAVKALEARSDAQLTRIGELEQQVSSLSADRDLLLDRLQALEARQAQLEAVLGSTDGSVVR